MDFDNISKRKARVFMFETAVEEQNKVLGVTSEDKVRPYPIGLTYLDAALKRNNYEVLTKDYTYWSEQNCLRAIRKELEKFRPNFVGISVMAMSRVSTYKAIRLIKKFNSDIKIILGGIHANVMFRQLLENFPIEAICLGEADESLPELLDALIKNKSKKKIKGLAYKEGNKIVVTKIRELRRDLDNIPFPSYDLFMSPKIKEVMMITSRGCPNKCSFCCLDILSRRIWRPRSPKNVVDEIEYIKTKYPWVKKIQFVDDTMILDNKRVIEICKEILRKKIKMEFVCQGRIRPVSKEMFYWMEKAGFVEVCFGIETGSKKLLHSIHKNITKEDCINTFNILKDFKRLQPTKYLIVGFPGEDEETVKETIEFVKQLQRIRKMHFFAVSLLWVYPGTEVYQMAVKKGVINDDFWLSDNVCPIFTLEHSKDQLVRWANKITVETMMDQGKIYFLKSVTKRVINNPRYYLRRSLAKSDLVGFQKS